MPAPTIANQKATTETKFGGDALNNVNRYLNGVNVTSVIGTPIIRTPTKIPSDILKFTDPAEDNTVTVKIPALSTDKTINLVPTNVEANDEVVYKDTVQTVTGKVISAGTNTITGLTNSNLSGSAAITDANLAQITNKAKLPSASVYTDQANSFGSGFMQTFRNGNIRFWNPAANFPYVWNTSAIAATRNITLPLLTGDDTLAFEAHAQSLTQKTVDSVQNIIKNLGNHLYDVFLDAADSLWKARNTKTGAITSSNSSLTTVLQAAINALTAARTVKETVKVRGSGNIAKITIPSYTRLDLTDAKFTLIASTNDHMFVNSDTSGGNTQIEIVGGYMDGNNDGGQGTVGTGDEDLKNVIHFEKVTNSFVLYTTITDTVCRGIRFRDCTNCVAAYNKIDDTGAEGIQSRGGSYNKILYNDIRDTGYSWITTYESPNNHIVGNYCDSIVSTTTSGINNSSLRTTIAHNRLYGNGNNAITLSEATSTYECSGSRILHNYIEGAENGSGIVGVGYVFKDLVIHGNEIWNCYESGIRISGQHKGVIISNNIVHDNRHSGINAGGTSGSSDPSAIMITGNICYNNGKGGGSDVERCGITIFGTGSAGIIDSIVSNNICYDTQGTKTQKYGVRAVNTDNCVIVNNLVRNNDTDGMILTTNTNLTSYNNKGYASDNVPIATNTANSFSALQTFRDNLIRFFNPGLTFPYMLRTSAIAASRDITLPLLTGNDTFVFEAHAQTLSSKTLTNPVLNGVTTAAPTAKTANYTLTASDWRIRCDSSSGSFTITLPTASGISGKTYRIKKTGTDYNYVIIDANSTETIAGLLTWELRSPEEFVEIVSDGTNWQVIDYNDFNMSFFRRTGTTEDRWYPAGQTGSTAIGTSSTLTAGQLWAVPLIISKPISVNDMGVNVITGVASSAFHLGIYKDINGYPGDLLLDAGEVLTATSTTFVSNNINPAKKLQPGLYWVACLVGVGGQSVRGLEIASMIPINGSTNVAATTNSSHLWQATGLTYASGLPTPFTGSASAGITRPPAVYIRYVA